MDAKIVMNTSAILDRYCLCINTSFVVRWGHQNDVQQKPCKPVDGTNTYT
jgi:hypothetical protein